MLCVDVRDGQGAVGSIQFRGIPVKSASGGYRINRLEKSSHTIRPVLGRHESELEPLVGEIVPQITEGAVQGHIGEFEWTIQ